MTVDINNLSVKKQIDLVLSDNSLFFKIKNPSYTLKRAYMGYSLLNILNIANIEKRDIISYLNILDKHEENTVILDSCVLTFSVLSKNLDKPEDYKIFIKALKVFDRILNKYGGYYAGESIRNQIIDNFFDIKNKELYKKIAKELLINSPFLYSRYIGMAIKVDIKERDKIHYCCIKYISNLSYEDKLYFFDKYSTQIASFICRFTIEDIKKIILSSKENAYKILPHLTHSQYKQIKKTIMEKYPDYISLIPFNAFNKKEQAKIIRDNIILDKNIKTSIFYKGEKFLSKDSFNYILSKDITIVLSMYNQDLTSKINKNNVINILKNSNKEEYYGILNSIDITKHLCYTEFKEIVKNFKNKKNLYLMYISKLISKENILNLEFYKIVLDINLEEVFIEVISYINKKFSYLEERILDLKNKFIPILLKNKPFMYFRLDAGLYSLNNCMALFKDIKDTNIISNNFKFLETKNDFLGYNNSKIPGLFKDFIMRVHKNNTIIIY